MGASRILTMLPSTPQVESVYLDPTSGILAGIPSTAPALAPECPDLTFEPGPESLDSATPDPDTPVETKDDGPHTLLIDGTTLNPTAAIKIAQKVHEATKGGALMLDAPVSGGMSICFCVVVLKTGIVAAEAAQLTIMFGSPSLHASSLAMPFLQRMARPNGVIACGGNGAGVGVKVCNKWVEEQTKQRGPNHQSNLGNQPDCSSRGFSAGQVVRHRPASIA